jgi:hypothetical protein
MVRKVFSSMIIFAGLTVAGASIAHDKCPGHRGPPPEALAACEDKSEGDACTVQLGDRTIDGTCEAPTNRKLACVPADMPPPPEPSEQKMD